MAGISTADNTMKFEPGHLSTANPDGRLFDQSTTDQEDLEVTLDSNDGTVNNSQNLKKTLPVAAVFVHAGAGYHSTTNERIHLQACSDAARVAMKFLKAGGSAVDAVEAAIKVLEDKEITNAGYGSNLSMDGTVECDATIVDHLGRSGACGAVPNVKNPICLAKAILHTSNRPLTLRRVPPNLLVGNGAKEFAVELGVLTVDNELLVSDNARDRYARWLQDLERAEKRRKETEDKRAQFPIKFLDQESSGSPKSSPKSLPSLGNVQQRDHTNAILTGTWNEGQPDSPEPVSSPDAFSKQLSPEKNRSPLSVATPRAKPFGQATKSPLPVVPSTPTSPAAPRKRQRPTPPDSDGAMRDSMTNRATSSNRQVTQSYDGSFSVYSDQGAALEGAATLKDDVDDITDTVGAIAIDLMGNVAAGSSSGGIGMKHSGRVGPAALVNIGTAVIPRHSADQDGISVAAVTSGTGEHMATTASSLKCAERLYQNTRQGDDGQDRDEFDDDALMESFVSNDFMAHPGVRNAHSAGALGVMAVKRTTSGYYFYFAHNTDSFALCSYASTEREPSVVMSRLGEQRQVARGAKKIAIRK